VSLGPADLAFTPDEAWLLVRELSGRELTDDQLGTLLQRTEGWAMGIGLAAIGLRAADDPGRLIAEFSGRDGNVAGFLRDQVLAREVPVVRRFLTHTSVLRTLNGPLCDAITGETDGSAKLRSLEDRGMLLHRLPGSGARYAYHRLLREFLRHELRITEPEAEDTMLRRAATWHASHSQPDVAVRYLIDAQAWPSVVALVDHCGPAMLRAGRGADVARWLDAVPAGHETTDVELAIRGACLSTAVGAFARAADIVHHVERRDRSARQQLTVDVLRAMWGCFDTRAESALREVEDAQASLEAAPETDRSDTLGIASARALAASAAVLRARTAWLDGQVATGRRALAFIAGEHHHFAAERVRALSTLALLEAWAGDLCAAWSHANRVLAIAGRTGLLLHPAVVDGRLAAAHVLRERGDLGGAADALAEAYEVAIGTGPPSMYAPYALEQAGWYLANGQPQHGLCLLARCGAESATAWPAALASRRRAVEVELLVASGRSDRAEALLAATTPAAAGAEVSAAGVHAAVARGDLDAARARLRSWGAVEEEPIERLQHGLWLSIVDFEAGGRRQALDRALDVVQQAEPQGHIQVFLDAGRPGERLFRALYHTSPTPYIRRILQAAQTSSQASGPTVLGLSRRELEVVRYLPTPLASSEIAARLYISLNTLKTHLQAIYGKLGVTGRREAIRQAQRLGLA
jgi:LuxR family maltose regulon positive regulatory protein